MVVRFLHLKRPKEKKRGFKTTRKEKEYWRGILVHFFTPFFRISKYTAVWCLWRFEVYEVWRFFGIG